MGKWLSHAVQIIQEEFGNKFEYTILDTKLDTGGNYVALKIKMIETEVTLVSVYGPNMDDPYFYEKISEIIDDFQTPTIILCGDWNLVQNQQLDTQHYIRDNNVRSRTRVASLKEQYELCDPWRINNPQKRQFTWFQRNPKKISRLDFF